MLIIRYRNCILVMASRSRLRQKVLYYIRLSNLAKHLPSLGNLAFGTRKTMVKPLTFKGEKKTKKRKRTKEDVSEAGKGSSTVTGTGISDEREGWVTMEQSQELTGPVMLTFVRSSYLPQSHG